MAFTFTSGPHQSPASSLPPQVQKQVNTGTWGTGGNTCLITDPYFSVNSQMDIWVTGTTPQAGQWAYVFAFGTCTITSTSSESSGLTISYTIS